MADFINSSQKLIVIESNGLEFGSSGTEIINNLILDESVVTTTPNASVEVESNAPFSVSMTSQNTSKPNLVVTLGGNVADYILGKKYLVTITANGLTDILYVEFLFSQFFDPAFWTNTSQEDNVGGFFTLPQFEEGAKVITVLVNSKLRTIFEYVSLLNFKVLDIINRYKINKNLPDIINAAIFSGCIPQGYTGTITYIAGTTNISTIILQDNNADSDSYTKITFTYVSQQKTITNNGVNPAVSTNSNYSALNTISVDRVTDNSGTVKRYTISKIQVSRTSITFTSIIDSNYSVTMPLITGWTVTE